MTMVKCVEVTKQFPVQRGALRDTKGFTRALDGVSIEIGRSEVYGLVGESGSGKTTLGKLILGILRPDSGKIELGTSRMQAIFQDPHGSLDPKMKVLDIIAEGLIVGKPSLRGVPPKAGDEAISKRVEKVLDLVSLPKAAISKYPHQFSGGERQRIAIARAVITEPEFIVCDEPVSSLDVTVQLQILNLLKEIQKRFSMTYLFISHDLRVVHFMCDRVAVMKEGRVVEEGPTQKIYSNPSHPYTKLLLSSALKIS